MRYAIVVISPLILASCSFLGTDIDEIPAESESSTTTTQVLTVTSTTDSDVGPVPEVGAEDSLNLDTENIDSTLLESVASEVGCGYVAKPTRSETPQQLAERLSPLITPELSEAIASLRGGGTDILQVSPGAVTRLRYQVYQVGCAVTAIDLEGRQRLLPANIIVRIEEQEDGTYRVTEITDGLLVLP